MATDRHPEALVSTAWLADHLDDPDLRIYECTTYLRPAEPDDGVPYHPEAGFEDHGLRLSGFGLSAKAKGYLRSRLFLASAPELRPCAPTKIKARFLEVKAGVEQTTRLA
jgi:hypothetical protein